MIKNKKKYCFNKFILLLNFAKKEVNQYLHKKYSLQGKVIPSMHV